MSHCPSAGASGVFLSSSPNGSAGPLLDPGTRLERFELIRHLGSGRTAHVYLAHDAQRGHEVTLKMADLRPDAASSIALCMQREIEARHRLGTHPNALALFDAHRIRLGGMDLIVLSMEYADGGDFRQYLDRTRSDPAAPLAVGFAHVLDAARGLAALHRAGVVHLDFKPENLLCVRGVWKLSDFDHARPLEELAGQRFRETVPDESTGGLGTPAYRSPEAVRPGSGSVDSRADIFSLGVVLREVSSLPGLTRRRTSNSHGQPTLKRIGLILKRCLKADTTERFQLVDHVIEAMESELRGDRGRRTHRRWPRHDRQWRHVCRCLNEGRVRDARHLCQTLLTHSPHHPGVLEVLTEVEHQERYTLESARHLAESPGMIPLAEAIATVRQLIELAPEHELSGRLIQSIEQQISYGRSKLSHALSCLSSGQIRGFAAALDESSTQNPGNPVAADACLRAHDLVDQFSHSTERIGEALSRRHHRRALGLTRRHRRCLAQLRKRTPRLLACLQAGGQNSAGAEDVLDPHPS